MKYLNLMMLICLPLMAGATGLAVGLDDLYLQNNTTKQAKIMISNLSESVNTFKVNPHAICKVNHSIMFLPVVEESNNFVIMLANDNVVDPIVIDKFGLLTLASDSVIKANYSGNAKMYSLLGFCGNHLGQYKFLNVIPHTNESAAPDFELANCSNTSNFVYFINDKYIQVKKRQKYIDFGHVSACELVQSNYMGTESSP